MRHTNAEEHSLDKTLARDKADVCYTYPGHLEGGVPVQYTYLEGVGHVILTLATWKELYMYIILTWRVLVMLYLSWSHLEGVGCIILTLVT